MVSSVQNTAGVFVRGECRHVDHHEGTFVAIWCRDDCPKMRAFYLEAKSLPERDHSLVAPLGANERINFLEFFQLVDDRHDFITVFSHVMKHFVDSNRDRTPVRVSPFTKCVCHIAKFPFVQMT